MISSLSYWLRLVILVELTWSWKGCYDASMYGDFCICLMLTWMHAGGAERIYLIQLDFFGKDDVCRYFRQIFFLSQLAFNCYKNTTDNIAHAVENARIVIVFTLLRQEGSDGMHYEVRRY